jgi:hypothetical protein
MLGSAGGEERNEFTVSVLKWSNSFFLKSKLDMNNQANINENYQKTFGHFDIHRAFALNHWQGTASIPTFYLTAQFSYYISL